MLGSVGLFVTPWTVARQAPLSVEFSRQEYQSGLPFPTPGDFPNPGIKPDSCVSYIGRPILYHCATRLKLKKVWNTTSPFRYDLNQIPMIIQ